MFILYQKKPVVVWQLCRHHYVDMKMVDNKGFPANWLPTVS